MKNGSKCPKCNGEALLFIPGPTDGGVFDNSVRIGLTVFSAVPVDRYVCCDCGYSEEWVNVEDIPKLQKKYRQKPTEND